MTTQTHVLLADDSFDLRLLLSLALERAGYRVSQATNGEQALAMLTESQPEVAILDVVMPVMDGIAVCRAARSDPSLAHLTIVMMSGDDIEPEAMAAGADLFLPKPFVASRLISAMDRLLQPRNRAGNQMTSEPR